jgi:hypothetical protein
MLTHTTAANKTVGYWSAAMATAFSLTYVFAQLAEWFGWLGSEGGPESASTPLGIVLLLTPSLLLGAAFLVLLASITRPLHPRRRSGARQPSPSARSTRF